MIDVTSKSYKSYRPVLAFYEHLITWQQDNFEVVLYDILRYDRRTYKTRVFYQLRDREYPTRIKVIFSGDDLYVLGLLPSSSEQKKMEAVIDLLGFLTLSEDDVGDDYFKDYTPKQLAWRDSDRREELDLIQCVLEEEYCG